ncbi:uncharacterized protein LOC129926915 [Biomphalaria glabrata]|uniref:Uncharacterized protein LOC129926915 n=1 Tax=Biomphalaria glabrata TaxID=6526 RepID=A0A9W3AQN2_BIOGL|nr:uncharacterized protein LOC129926915 [Biomphalaria glabrata]
MNEIATIIEDVAEEQISVINLEHESHQAKGIQSLPQVNLHIVKDVCTKLDKEISFPVQFKHELQNIDYDKLADSLMFLNGCLVTKSRFVSSCTERAWKNYYRSYIINMGLVKEVVKCQQLSAWISLKVFEHLIILAYGNKMEKNVTIINTLKDQEKSTINYIGGCIVKKIKRKVMRSAKTETRDKKLYCLSLLVCQSQEETVENQMTFLLDRGGLTYIKSKVANLLYEAETTFQDMVGAKDQLKLRNISVSDFLQKCLDNQLITSAFYGLINDGNKIVNDEIMGEILDTIIILFFKIRMHHKLKVLMDSIRKQENKSRKEKSLRKKLKSSHPTETNNIETETNKI